MFTLWITVFLRSIPSFIDGSLFKAPYVPDLEAPPPKKVDVEKGFVIGVGIVDRPDASASTVAL